MSFFSQSTSRRLVNNQLANNKSYVMQKYEESVSQASISSKPRSFGALKKFYVNSITTVFKDTLLLYGEEGRNLEFIILMPFTPDEDNQMPHRAMIVHYHINLRSCSSKMREIAIVTTHAMERIIERRRDVRLITLMSEEFNLGLRRPAARSTAVHRNLVLTHQRKETKCLNSSCVAAVPISPVGTVLCGRPKSGPWSWPRTGSRLKNAETACTVGSMVTATSPA